MIVAAVNAHTGELAAFDRDSGVDLVDAVTATTAMPGMAPTHSINGARYINGGVRSGENADLASGYANVVVLSPFGGWSQAPLPEGQFEGLRRPPGADLASEVEDAQRYTVICEEPQKLTGRRQPVGFAALRNRDWRRHSSILAACTLKAKVCGKALGLP